MTYTKLKSLHSTYLYDRRLAAHVAEALRGACPRYRGGAESGDIALLRGIKYVSVLECLIINSKQNEVGA